VVPLARVYGDAGLHDNSHDWLVPVLGLAFGRAAIAYTAGIVRRPAGSRRRRCLLRSSGWPRCWPPCSCACGCRPAAQPAGRVSAAIVVLAGIALVAGRRERAGRTGRVSWRARPEGRGGAPSEREVHPSRRAGIPAAARLDGFVPQRHRGAATTTEPDVVGALIGARRCRKRLIEGPRSPPAGGARTSSSMSSGGPAGSAVLLVAPPRLMPPACSTAVPSLVTPGDSTPPTSRARPSRGIVP